MNDIDYIINSLLGLSVLILLILSLIIHISLIITKSIKGLRIFINFQQLQQFKDLCANEKSSVRIFYRSILISFYVVAIFALICLLVYFAMVMNYKG